jgi:DNA polymerase-3 subunit epsilon
MYAVIDVETTGGSPAVDRLTEIAILVFDGNKVIEEFQSLVNPSRSIDPWVVKLTGITQEMVQNAPTFEQIHHKILELTKGNIFTAHNVKFDFGMIRNEFKRIGIDFACKQLDTVSLSRRIMPGLTSYSLGKLCDSIGINIENRHRALGDAAATVKLLELMLAADNAEKFLDIELRDGLDVNALPPQLKAAHIEVLPEEPGIFYLKDESGSVLYIEGSKNIRKKVIQQFAKGADDVLQKKMLDTIHSIDYELTGSELIAKLRVLKQQNKSGSAYNKPIKENVPAFGLYIVPDEDEVLHLKILPLKTDPDGTALKFTSRASAARVHAKITTDNNLYGHYAMLNRLKETNQDISKLRDTLNQKINQAVKRYLFRASNFFVIGEGMHPDETSVVWVENNQYKGFGFFFKEVMQPTIENLKEVIKPDVHSNEAQKIIRQYLKKAKPHLITY